MTIKEQVTARLEKIKSLEGVFPTGRSDKNAERSRWRSIANDVTSKEIATAEEHSRTLLRETLSDAEVMDTAIDLFSGSSGMREQFAGFARAGIGFFHASDSYAGLSLNARQSRGGNGAIQRVMVEDTRVLLEPERVVVRFEREAKAPERRLLLEKHGLAEIEPNGLKENTFRTSCLRGFALDAAMSIMGEKGVVYAEPDFIEHIGERNVPNDPLFLQQWHHGVIECESAWKRTTGKGVRIVVIDNGFDISHADLALGPLSAWYRRTTDLADADFVHGMNGMPDSDHGTACAGMIAAAGNNAIGGCGVAFGSELSMLACLPDQVGPQTTLARAIGYAADPKTEGLADQPGADIIACSLGPSSSAAWTMRQVLSDAIDFASTKGRKGKGTLILWAATNGNHPISADQVCSHPKVCAIGRSTSADADDGSGFGPELEYLAPGVDVMIPTSGNGYGLTTGTSFAAPCAAGVAALALSANPKLTAKKLRDVMRKACDKIGPLNYDKDRNVRFGFGRVNALKAVQGAEALIAATPPPTA